MASVRLVAMKNRPPRRPSPLSEHMLEEIAELFSGTHWIEFEPIHAAIMVNLPDDCKTGDVDKWIRDRLARLLEDWIDRGLIEKLGSQYRALKGLSEVKAHLAAKHCGDFLDLVRKPASRT
jgi:hypothetical protein